MKGSWRSTCESWWPLAAAPYFSHSNAPLLQPPLPLAGNSNDNWRPGKQRQWLRELVVTEVVMAAEIGGMRVPDFPTVGHKITRFEKQ